MQNVFMLRAKKKKQKKNPLANCLNALKYLKKYAWKYLFLKVEMLVEDNSCL